MLQVVISEASFLIFGKPVDTFDLDDAALLQSTELCYILQYVSLNVRGIRKVLNKLDRSASDSPQKPQDGCMALQVERPHHPGSTTFQVAVMLVSKALRLYICS